MTKLTVVTVSKDENGKYIHKVYHKPTYRSSFNKLTIVTEGYWEVLDRSQVVDEFINVLYECERIHWSDEPNELFKSVVDDVLKNLRSC